MENMDYYFVLNVGKDVTTDDLRRAYRKEAVRWHPDKNEDKSLEVTFHTRFQLIAEAYQVLKEPRQRSLYDRLGHAAFKRMTESKGPEEMGEYADSERQRTRPPSPSSSSLFGREEGAEDFFSVPFSGFFVDPFQLFQEFFQRQEQMLSQHQRLFDTIRWMNAIKTSSAPSSLSSSPSASASASASASSSSTSLLTSPSAFSSFSVQHHQPQPASKTFISIPIRDLSSSCSSSSSPSSSSEASAYLQRKRREEEEEEEEKEEEEEEEEEQEQEQEQEQEEEENIEEGMLDDDEIQEEAEKEEEGEDDVLVMEETGWRPVHSTAAEELEEEEEEEEQEQEQEQEEDEEEQGQELETEDDEVEIIEPEEWEQRRIGNEAEFQAKQGGRISLPPQVILLSDDEEEEGEKEEAVVPPPPPPLKLFQE